MYNLVLNMGKDVNKVLLNQMSVIGGTNGFKTKIILDVKYGYIVKFESNDFFNLNGIKLVNDLRNLFNKYELNLNMYISLSEES